MSEKHNLPPLLSPAERGFIVSDLNRNLTGFKGWSWDDVVQATELVVRTQFTEHIQRLQARAEELEKALRICRDTIPHVGGNYASITALRVVIDAAMTKEQNT